MAIWTQSGCANLHINICLQAGLSSGEGGGGAGNGDPGGRVQVGQGGGGALQGTRGQSQQRQQRRVNRVGSQPAGEEPANTVAGQVQAQDTGPCSPLVPIRPQGHDGSKKRDVAEALAQTGHRSQEQREGGRRNKWGMSPATLPRQSDCCHLTHGNRTFGVEECLRTPFLIDLPLPGPGPILHSN